VRGYIIFDDESGTPSAKFSAADGFVLQGFLKTVT
jgi:hypothetical protein